VAWVSQICELGELKLLRKIPSSTRESNFFFYSVICKLGELKILRKIPSRTRKVTFLFCEIRKDNQQDVSRA
jgi:hypothetical protein